ncbi:antitoxin [Corynebacterium hansenii]|uniref:Antitoxin n=1 Tax=Corynebacterium hansenii TaxID=394964 RepID=A0ABV7ZQ37_9CORY|nr:antitoxin [Corynebacterium hansenii]WJZ01257.1 Antitoxin [Corynebacterium hansenii]
MGIFDKAKQFAADNPDKVSQGIDKAGDAIDERTGGKHSEQIDKAQDAARKHLADGEGEQPQQ